MLQLQASFSNCVLFRQNTKFKNVFKFEFFYVTSCSTDQTLHTLKTLMTRLVTDIEISGRKFDILKFRIFRFVLPRIRFYIFLKLWHDVHTLKYFVFQINFRNTYSPTDEHKFPSQILLLVCAVNKSPLALPLAAWALTSLLLACARNLVKRHLSLTSCKAA
jgi:hypothetical protein